MPDQLAPKYKRVLLKLSGESLGYGGSKLGINLDETKAVAEQLKRVHTREVELAVVVGGGNLLRGAQFTAAGVPAFNFGPGLPEQAHQAGEYCPLPNLGRAYECLQAFLTA